MSDKHYVITEPCINVKDTACVDACPVDCIHPRKDEPAFSEAPMLFINPNECIDCGACEPACPVTAIFAPDMVPAGQEQFSSERVAELITLYGPGLSCYKPLDLR